eukprot:CAMPEP_0184861448 /NCGR_PEP_ID=MMETSP0580-20130426/6137_1 /TAXON_ID=1118495 /ORGANISM="Dactyliosolen fragilissimus" /LENGTH=648 /DNA_ID=CAMNT_0027358957 /DNA_START=1 /DNA_END=1947 /DNA_ORIENTATION=-
MASSRKSEKTIEGLLPIVQHRIKTDILQNPCEKWNDWMILIVDEGTMRIMSSAVGMYDLMEHKITLVEDIAKRRAPFRRNAPIYFLTPTEESIDILVEDWTPSKSRKEPLYADSVFLYFTQKVPDKLFAKIKQCKPLARRLKAFAEVNLGFLAKETRSFHLDMSASFSNLYNQPSMSIVTDTHHAIVSKLVTVCATLNEYPHIRYRTSSDLCTILANLFHKQFTEFIASNKSWWYHGDSSHLDKPRSTLLILSRSDDCLSPLMHEFTYQAMVYDLLNVGDDGKITYKAETSGTAKDTGDAKATMDKDALLNESDNLWVELKGQHIADISKIISTRIRDVVNSSTGVVMKTKSRDETKALSITQVANAMKALPEYREVLARLSQHLRISHQCFEIFSKQTLMDLSDLEQTLATGIMDDGRKPKVSELVASVEQELKHRKDYSAKFRLLAVFIVSQNGLKDEDYKRLISAAALDTAHLKALSNLEKLGLKILKDGAGRGNNIMGEKLAAGRANDSDEGYISSRYVSELKGILKQMQDGSLSIDEYPSILPLPDEGVPYSAKIGSNVERSRLTGSVRQTKNSQLRRAQKPAKDSKVAKFFGARKIVFMAGGLCYSELRSAQELMDKGGNEIILGSTRFISPKDFVDDLINL